MARRKLFSEYGPLFFWIAQQKETLKRRLSDARSKELFCGTIGDEKLSHLVMSHSSTLMRQLLGLDMQLQVNKVTNLRLATAPINGILIKPGELFSLWHLVGKPSARRGYLPGMVLEGHAVKAEVGGGLCQLSNLIHWLILHTPLEIAELHHHTDALFPDVGRRVPFGTGTSIFYNYLDYRFRNNSEQCLQLLIWLTETHLCGELRSEYAFPLIYRIEEEDHHFVREGEEYYRNSRIYKRGYDPKSGSLVSEELVLRNHSRVLYDPALIPPEQLRL